MRKVNLSKILGFAAALLIAIGCIMPAVFAAAPSDALDSVVFIESEPKPSDKPGDRGNRGVGSGFAIGEVGKPVEYIVTTNHAVRGDWGYTTASVYFSYATGDCMVASIYYYDYDKDIAILKLPEPTEKISAMTLSPMEFIDLDGEYAALGYPNGQVDDWTKYSKEDITITKCGIKTTSRIEGMDVYTLDVQIPYGNAGGPLVNSAGEVVGLNMFQISGASGTNYAYAIDEIISLIDTDKIPLTIHSGGIPVYVIAAAFIIVVIIIIILIVVLTRGKKEESVQESAPVSAPAPAPAPAPKTARIIAVGGILNGKKYTVNGTVKLGRDSSKCQIAFPLNTQGVSAVHCELTYDGSVFYIRDLNSSDGTCVSNGKKLEPNAGTRLNSGD
ncbi:MAG: trypsin-like peptidase domain-containing protein [Eubacterium sp.]|nr:trypsin-like peptidase domain-containing protein [Eubacterium sp.]